MEDRILVFKWNGKEEEVGIGGCETLGDLKARIFTLLDVRPENQKLMGLKLKARGKVNVGADETELSAVDLDSKVKPILMGQPDHVLEKAKQAEEEAKALQRTEGEEAEEEEEEEREDCSKALMAVFEQKVDRRITSYKIEELNPLREGKKLLVLDIDYTLYDHRSEAESISILMRPHLHTFLAAAYADYDIVIWSATSMKWITAKLKEMGLLDSESFKIAFCLDFYAMISIHTEKTGCVEVKPLRLIWARYPDRFSPANTIMFDDITRNFFMNPKNGLRIRPYKRAHLNKDTDTELLKLSQYLDAIASRESDFSGLDHSRWRKYLELLPPPPKVPKVDQ